MEIGLQSERNEHRHVLITFIGTCLTGAQEGVRLASGGYQFSSHAKSCFESRNADSYDTKHRLVAGQIYTVALVPAKEISRDCDRSPANLRKVVMEKYKYGKPLGGHIPRIRETISDKQMEDMGIWEIIGLHDPIKCGNDRLMLRARRGNDGPWVSVCWDSPGFLWHEDAAYEFPVFSAR